MNKKLVLTAIMLLLAMAATTLITYKSLEGLKDLNLEDPFEADFDED